MAALPLGHPVFGLVTSFHFEVGFGERQVAGEPEGITEYYFTVGANGSAKLRAFGFTFAGVSIGFNVTAAGSGRVPVTVSARAKLSFFFFSVSVRMRFNLGYIEMPRIVYLAGNGNGDTRLWDPQASNGDLYLNMGHRNTERGIAEGADNELYLIEHLDSDENGEIIRVKFSGREKIYRGVDRIYAIGGDGDDHIYIDENVTSDVEFHGGPRNDVFIYEGKGTAYLYGDDGDDYIVTESDTAYIEGGAGRDYIVHNGSGQAFIDGGADEDQLYGGPGNDVIRGGSGNDEIYGNGWR